MPIAAPHEASRNAPDALCKVCVHGMRHLHPQTGRWLPDALECIDIPSTLYRPALLVVRMADAGMEPLIKRHAYVGVDRAATSVIADGVVAVDIAGEGLAIRRVARDATGSRLVLRAEAQSHGVPVLPLDDPVCAVIGTVVWVIQDL